MREINPKEVIYDPSQRVTEQLDRAFTYHAPTGDQPKRYEQIRTTAHALATIITVLTPESREQSIALTRLEEAVMFAGAAIARNE